MLGVGNVLSTVSGPIYFDTLPGLSTTFSVEIATSSPIWNSSSFFLPSTMSALRTFASSNANLANLVASLISSINFSVFVQL